MEGLPRWEISSRPGPTPRQHKHGRWYTPFTLTRQICKDDYDGQMICRDLVGLKLPDICLVDEEKPQKNLTQETCPDQGLNPGPLCDKHSCYCLLYSSGWTQLIKSVVLQPWRAKANWSGCCQVAVQGALWLAKWSMNLNFSFINWILLLLIQVATQLSSRC